MTDSERFELLWNHYHRQIDENRNVSNHIEAFYKGLKDILDTDKALTKVLIDEIEKLIITVDNLKK